MIEAGIVICKQEAFLNGPSQARSTGDSCKRRAFGRVDEVISTLPSLPNGMSVAGANHLGARTFLNRDRQLDRWRNLKLSGNPFGSRYYRRQMVLIQSLLTLS